MFSKSVNNLPNNITHLIFGINFNQPLENLPNSITHLSLDWSFDLPIDKIIYQIHYYI